MSNFWKDITSHKGNGWWNLPETTQSETNPINEGPISIPWLKKIWNIISHGNVEHAGPTFYTVIAVFLAVVTLIELWIYTVETLGGWLNPLLFILSALKFVGIDSTVQKKYLGFFGKIFSSPVINATLSFPTFLITLS